MTITLKATIPITIIAVYAPTAQQPSLNKIQFYDTIKTIFNKYKSKHIVHIVGDFNARIQIKTAEAETCIGEHTFNKENITLDKQDEQMEESRQLFIELCISTNTLTMNTQFQKTTTN